MTTQTSAPNPSQVPSAHPGQAVVLYDGDCPLCRKSVAMLRRLDWMNVLRFANAREPGQVPAGVTVNPERLLEEMHLLTPDGRQVYHGFGAFRWMAWRLPLLWFMVPFLYLPGAATLGQRVYLWVARNRFRLVPCHGGVCTLPQRPGRQPPPGGHARGPREPSSSS